MAEGARLESVFRGNSNVGSNPTLSAMFSTTWRICDPLGDPLSVSQRQTSYFCACLGHLIRHNVAVNVQRCANVRMAH